MNGVRHCASGSRGSNWVFDQIVVVSALASFRLSSIASEVVICRAGHLAPLQTSAAGRGICKDDRDLSSLTSFTETRTNSCIYDIETLPVFRKTSRRQTSRRQRPRQRSVLNKNKDREASLFGDCCSSCV